MPPILRFIRLTGLCFWPEILAAFTVITTPRYAGEFWQKPIGMICAAIMIGWSICSLLILRSRAPIFLKIIWFSCSLPLSMLSMLGPAILTIINAMEPTLR